MKFEDFPYSERVLFIAHCLRDIINCNNEYDKNGLVCGSEHEECLAGKIKAYASALGYKNVYIVQGGKIVLRLINEIDPKAVVGIACNDELKMAIKKLKKDKPDVAVLAIKIENADCSGSKINLEEVIKKIT